MQEIQGLIPGLGRSPGRGNGNTFQYSCLENPMDWRAWLATVHRVANNWTRPSDWACMYTRTCACTHTHTHTHDYFNYLDLFLWFHTHFRIIFSYISVKNATRILIETALNQYIALNIMDILALLTFTIHKNWISCQSFVFSVSFINVL